MGRLQVEAVVQAVRAQRQDRQQPVQHQAPADWLKTARLEERFPAALGHVDQEVVEEMSVVLQADQAETALNGTHHTGLAGVAQAHTMRAADLEGLAGCMVEERAIAVVQPLVTSAVKGL